jgi:hypothetical protein
MPEPYPRARLCHSAGMAGDDIDAIIENLGDWRGEVLARLRALIKEAEPDVVEETKWQKKTNPLGVPVWSRDGIICTGESYKDKVKLTFMNGAGVPDPTGLFNSGLDSRVRRVIDIGRGDELDADAFKDLIRAAAKQNAS